MRFSGGSTATVDVTDRAARLLGVADVTDRANRSLGIVQRIEESRTNSGGAFVGGTLINPVVTLGHIQLHNPAASGITVALKGILCSLSLNNIVRLRSHNAALATLVNAGRNRRTGSAAALAEIRTLDGAAAGTDMAPLMIGSASNFPPLLVADHPLYITAGNSIIVASEAAAGILLVAFFWDEL